MAIQVELVSPERILYSGEADMVVCRTVAGGEVAFLTGHAPFLAALETGVVRVKTGSGEEVAAVHGGFVEVRDDRVTVLSDVAELPEQIDTARAQAALARAQEAAKGSEDADEAAAAVRRAEVRLLVAGQKTTAAAH